MSNPNIVQNDLTYALDKTIREIGIVSANGAVKNEGKVRFIITGSGISNLIRVTARIIGQEDWTQLVDLTGDVNQLVDVFTWDFLRVECIVYDATSDSVRLHASSFNSSAIGGIEVPGGEIISNFDTVSFTSSDSSVIIVGDPLTGEIDFTTVSVVGGVSSVNTRTGDVVLDKTDVNLGNVDNTSDADKPISDDTQAALDLITNVTWTGDYNNGVTYTVGSGVMYNGASFRMIAAIGAAGYPPVAYPANWLQVTDYVSPNDIGLGNVDNTSDADKPISGDTQDALDLKVAKAGDTMSGLLDITVTGAAALEANDIVIGNPWGAGYSVITGKDGSTDALYIQSADQLGTFAGNSSKPVTVGSGYTQGANSGDVEVLSAPAAVSGASGSVYIHSGDTVGATGFTTVKSGNSSSSSTGTAVLRSGDAAVSSGNTQVRSGNSVGNSGVTSLFSGQSSGANSGQVQVQSGAAAVASGNILISSGSAATRGLVQIDGSKLNMLTSIDMNSSKITELLNPTDNQDAATKKYTDDADALKQSLIDKNQANGYVGLNGSTKIDSIYLPSYVDDVLEFASLSVFPLVGEAGIIYLALDTNLCYRWAGSVYVEISAAPVFSVNTKVGAVVLDKTDIGLDQVDNTSDADKPISDDTQLALDDKVSKTGDTMTGQLTMQDDSILIDASISEGMPNTLLIEAGTIQSTIINANITSTSILYPYLHTIQTTDSVSTSNTSLNISAEHNAPILEVSIVNAETEMDSTVNILNSGLYVTNIDYTNNNELLGNFIAGSFTIETILADSSNTTIVGDPTGITLSSFDGDITTSPLMPASDFHVTVKKYVDDADALKVNRSDTDNATEVWVSPSGNNSQLNVGSQFYPYATIQQAFNDIPNATSIQQWANERIVIHLKTGEYNESPILFYKRRSVTVVGHGAKLLQDITLNYDPKNQYPGFTYTQASLPAPWTNGFASPTLSLCCENDANGMESGFTTGAMMFLGAIKFIIANYATQATPNYGTSYVTMNGVEARGGFQVLDAGSSSNGSVTLEVMTSVINGANIGLTRAGGLGSGFTLKATDSRITSDIGPRIVINKLESCRIGKLDRTYGGYTEGAIQFINTTATTGITNCTFVGTGTQYIGNTTGTANSTIKLDLATWYQLRALTLDYGTGCLFNIMDSSKLVRVIAAEAGSTTMTNVTDHLFLDPVSTRAAYTVTMKPNPVDGDEVQISSGAFGVTALTLLGNTGQNINGAITGLPSNSWAKYRWNLATTRWIFSGSYLSSIQADINSKIPLAEKGAPDGVVPLNSISKIDATYLPSYVDDVLEFANLAAFPVTGTAGIIYVALDTNKIYRWNTTVYTELSTAPVTSVNGKTNAVTLNAIDVPFSPTLTILSDNVQDAIVEIQAGATGTAIYQDTKEPTGFINRTDSTTSFVDGSRLFTIAPVSASFSFYIKGTKFTKTTSQQITIPNFAGNHYIYFNTSGVLESTQIFSSDIIEQNAFVSVIYWNTDLNTHTYFAEERHGITMDGATHIYLHTTFGARYLSGLALQGFTPDGNGSLDAHAQFTADEGSIRDEDILLSSAAQAQIPILFRQGQLWRKKAADAFPLIYSGTAGYTGANGRIPFNQFTGGSWQLTQVTSGDYVLVHFFATNDKENPIVGIQGIAQYNNAPQAKAAASTEITSLSGLPFAEFVAIGTVLFQTNTYANTPDARVVSVNGATYIDFRGTQLYTPAGEATEHSLLSGLADDDHIQYHTDARGDIRYYTKSQVEALIDGISSAGDIDETSFNISNSQALPDNVHNFLFSNAVVRGFTALVTVEIDATTDLFEEFTLNGIQKGASWGMSIESQGDDSGVVFSITSAGQIQYTSDNYTGFVSGIIKFRAITTSI